MKINKMIAVLGVVAGSYTSMLPLTAYGVATCTNNGRQCADTVDVHVNVNPVIAMQIVSNNDTATSQVQAYSEGSEPETPTAADPAAQEGPSLATGLSLSANQADLTTLWSVVKVRSNTGAFTLTLRDADGSTNLDLATPSAVANEYIPAQDGEPTAETAGWAVKGGNLADWSAMPNSSADGLVIASNGSNDVTPTTAYSDDIKVNYGIASGTTKAGKYSDTIVYTATTK